MAKYAVVDIAGKQYKVEEGQELVVDKISVQLSAGSAQIAFDNVMLVVDGDKTRVGSPTVKGAKVEALVLGQERGDKVRVVKFKAKSRYRKVRGFRSSKSRVKIVKIVN